MYVGRDMTQLSMIPKQKWDKEELAYFHHSLQQMLPYLNAEGQTIYKEIVTEIKDRGGLHRNEALVHGTDVSYD